MIGVTEKMLIFRFLPLYYNCSNPLNIKQDVDILLARFPFVLCCIKPQSSTNTMKVSQVYQAPSHPLCPKQKIN